MNAPEITTSCELPEDEPGAVRKSTGRSVHTFSYAIAGPCRKAGVCRGRSGTVGANHADRRGQPRLTPPVVRSRSRNAAPSGRCAGCRQSSRSFPKVAGSGQRHRGAGEVHVVEDVVAFSPERHRVHLVKLEALHNRHVGGEVARSAERVASGVAGVAGTRERELVHGSGRVEPHTIAAPLHAADAAVLPSNWPRSCHPTLWPGST